MTPGSLHCDVSADKTELRRHLRVARREALPTRDVRAESEALADAVAALVAEVTQGEVCVVAAYESLPTEPPTDLLVERLTEAGHTVLLPVTLPDKDLDWRVSQDDAGTDPQAYQGVDAIARAAVVVLPALAVDRTGHRLGQGGGSYDRALPRRNHDALLVALVHDTEVLDADRIPVLDHDVLVDVVITPGRGAVSLRPDRRSG